VCSSDLGEDGTPRASRLWAYRSEGKTKYKPIIGSARDIV
jgi:hypothetical protein